MAFADKELLQVSQGYCPVTWSSGHWKLSVSGLLLSGPVVKFAASIVYAKTSLASLSNVKPLIQMLIKFTVDSRECLSINPFSPQSFLCADLLFVKLNDLSLFPPVSCWT